MATKKYRVLFCLAGGETKASSRVRGFWICDELRKLGCDCVIIEQRNRFSVVKVLVSLLWCEVLVFQKTYSRYHLMLARLANWLGKITVLDIDDAPSRTQNSTTLSNFETMAELVQVVAVGGSALEGMVADGSDKVVVVPSSVPLDVYSVKEDTVQPDVLCLGWIGNGPHYADDLIEILTGPLTEIASEQPIALKLVGTCHEARLKKAFAQIPGLEFVAVDSLDWGNPREVCEQIKSFDIGIYPLRGNYFNQYKCGFKAIEYMAVGLPVIASNVAVNPEIVVHGRTGFVVNTPAEWGEAIRELVSNRALREDFGREGRRLIEQRYSTANAARLLYQAISHAK